MPEPKTALPRMLELALLLAGLCWLGAAYFAAGHGAEGIAVRFNLLPLLPLLEAIFFLFLLLCGFTLLNWIARRDGSVRLANALPRRPTASREWATGAAIGWAALLAALLLPMLTGSLRPQFWWKGRAWEASLLALLTAAVGTLAVEVAFRGFLLRRATSALGTAGGSLLMAVIFALVATSRPNATGLSITIAFFAAFLLSMAYFRTHALWLGWGLHFAWAAALTVLFGLPGSGAVAFNGVVDTESVGRPWLSGGAYGPEASLPTFLLVLIAMVVVYRVTRGYAWEYTHTPIVAAGYPMDVAPPAAHAAMEAAAPPPPLVQILSSTPAGPSSHPALPTLPSVAGTPSSSASRPTLGDTTHDEF